MIDVVSLVKRGLTPEEAMQYAAFREKFGEFPIVWTKEQDSTPGLLEETRVYGLLEAKLK